MNLKKLLDLNDKITFKIAMDILKEENYKGFKIKFFTEKEKEDRKNIVFFYRYFKSNI